MNNSERKLTEEIVYERIRLLSVLEVIPAFVFLQDRDYSIRFANRRFRDLFGDPEGLPCYKVIHGRTEPCEPCLTFRVFETKETEQWEWTSKFGQTYMIYDSPLSDIDGSQLVLEMGIDITELRNAEKVLKKSRNELEKRVAERTSELAETNLELQKKIIEHKKAEEALKVKTIHLEEANTALKVLLERQNKDKTEIEEKVLLNVRELVIPYLEKLKKSGLNDKQATYTDIIESNLKDITSSFVRGLSLGDLKLTSSEMLVANLIKQGKSTKEIALLSDLSPRTIEFHRYNLRKKIGIKNKKINLRTYLISIQS